MKGTGTVEESLRAEQLLQLILQSADICHRAYLGMLQCVSMLCLQRWT